MKKVFFVLFLLTIIQGSSCSNSKKDVTQASGEVKEEVSKPIGSRVYKLNCEICHGADGKLGANGSKDLTACVLTLEERIVQITKGKGAMAAYENLLSKDEIQAVAEYTMQLKK